MKKYSKNLQFTVYIEQDEDSVFIGSIPALSGCHAQGDTQEEMLKNLSEVIKLCLRNDDTEEIKKHRFVGIQNLEFSHA
ncbi:MAG: type II toxin-antitoxin system HicB family antitoxin [Candidatus Kerfeldbacteria bacterium]|nr:type II toxin-antitoxin system HicB family antitoxin [Candidatus Kerfeldbacteria bacterium]